MDSMFDVLVIGGGVVGCNMAHELSKYDLKLALVEKESDVCGGASKANSGVVHSGIYSQPGSLKAGLCVKGNTLFPTFVEELGVDFKRIGKLAVARNEVEIRELEKLKEVGDKNRVWDLEFLDEEEVKKLEPNINAQKGLWVPSAGIVSPYHLTIALAENAWENKVKIFLDSEVADISPKEGYFGVKTKNLNLKSRWIINSAGLYCDKIAEMVGITKHRVYPCRGEYLILDKSYSHLINHLIYPPPENGSGGLGVHLTPTIEGNILIGPSAKYIEGKEDTRTTKEGMEKLLLGATSLLKNLPKDAYIQSYAGIRCKLIPQTCEFSGDFVIEEDEGVKGFINLMGIESPGLSASPAITKKVVDIIKANEDLKIKEDFKTRKGRMRFHKLDLKEKVNLIDSNPRHGHLICRCENVTEREVIDAIENPLEVRTLSGIKYRCRATMGRCQGGFCRARIVKIMEEQFGEDVKDITQRGPGSFLFVGRTKDLRKHDSKEC
ncbi:MAG: NAD(P)/FAD-dependent oxidoreductase [Thermoplasmata archaeon]|nr:MAG: NAD(P)/FAD-dependent oxidoreductase [Thermoplasmata archaeon]